MWRHSPPALCRSLFEAAFSCFAPPRCRSCRAPLFAYDNPYLCSSCAGKVRWIGGGACGKCGFPAGQPHEDGAFLRDGCARCRGKTLHLDAAIAVARYQDGAGNLIRSFKYGGETELGRPLAGMMAERLRGADFFEKIDLIAPVALHPERKRERGFDQAKILADRVAKATGLASRDDVLERRTRTMPQASLHRKERLRNMEGVFAANGDRVCGRRILLVADVLTTGATMADCARACREAGA
ncbi:MAG: ComF family protein, partial [Planctomycetota bacterium]|nr:ComF family protein [Planctomycetota bacterium]